MNAKSAMVGVRGRDLFSTLRTLAFQGLRQPMHSTRHLMAFGKQLGRVMLGDTPYQPNPQDSRFADPTWHLNPFYRRSLQAYLAWQRQLKAWIDESDLSPDDRTRAHFLFALLNDALAPSNTLLNPLAIKELFNSGGTSVLRGARQMLDDMLHNSGLPQQVNKQAFEVGRNLAVTPGAVVFRCEMSS
jgi:polyhydroxyalkanoate synthase